MGNKDGRICSRKSRQSAVSCSQAGSCQLLSFLSPSSLTLLPQVGKAKIRKFPSLLLCLVRLSCLTLVGMEVNHNETGSHTAPTVGCTPPPTGRTHPQLQKPSVREFIVKQYWRIVVANTVYFWLCAASGIKHR